MALCAALLVAALTLGTLGVVAWRAGGMTGLSEADLSALRFTLWQAVWSAGLSVLLAIPVARALARRTFPGRGLLVTLIGAPFILPTLVAILGLVTVFGRSGVVNTALDTLGLPQVSPYGPWGVVMAHVFFNMPLAVRLYLQGWQAIPAERMRTAASLDFGHWAMFWHLERPMLLASAPGAALLIFAICLTSFAVALAMGGGPRATTVELAIYQAFAFEADLGKAAQLALIQFALAAVAAILAALVTRQVSFGTGLHPLETRWDGARAVPRVLDVLWIGMASAFLLGPLLAVVLSGVPGLISLPSQVWVALGNSVVVSLACVALTLALALPLSLATVQRSGATDGLAALALAASPLVVGTGLYVLVFPWVAPQDVALPVTVAVNAALALPFALRALAPATRDLALGYGRLAGSLGMAGFARLRLVTLPRLRRPLGFAAGLTAALSMGDLGVIALFADADRATLPLQMYRLMDAYRLDEAAGAALVLLAVSLGLFWAFDRIGVGRAAV